MIQWRTLRIFVLLAVLILGIAVMTVLTFYFGDVEDGPKKVDPVLTPGPTPDKSIEVPGSSPSVELPAFPAVIITPAPNPFEEE